MLAIWSLVPLPFLNPPWTSGNSWFTYCWSLAWRHLSITLLVCEKSAIVWWFEHSLALPFFGIGTKTALFQSCGHCWVFQTCWYIECNTFPASFFRIWKEYIKSGERSKVEKSLSSIESPTISLPGNNYFSFICALPKIVCANANIWGFPGGSMGKESACSAEDTGDAGATPGSGRSLGEGNGNLLQYSSLGNSTDKGPWWAIVHEVAKSQTWLSDWAQHSM